MRAILYDRYGPASLLRLAEVPEPGPLRRGQVRLRIACAALNPKDAFVRKGRFRALSGSGFPKRCGVDAAGVVLESRAAHLVPGQRAFGFLEEWRLRRGTLAEQAVFEGHELAATPDGVDDAAAAGMALAGSTALQALRDLGRLRPGQRVLVNGASGGVGTAAVQLARLLGAEVHTLTGPANRPLCAELGAHAAWSYEEDAWKGQGPFDLVFDVFGNLALAGLRPLLAPGGRFISTVPTPGRLLREGLARLTGRGERLVVVRPRTADLAQLAAWLAGGRVRTIIDARFALADLRAAFARLESKRTRGKIVIDVG
ncbi:MAG: NAD(P)-dependent alcohol dehydrogenase [Anaeromyxobacter sp.]